MSRIKWLLLLCLAFVPSSKAATKPYITNKCLHPYINPSGVSSTNCVMSNTKAGRLIVGWATGSASTIAVSSATESLTNCVTGTFISNGWQTTVCSVIAASDHATFTVTGASSGGFNRVLGVGAIEYNVGASASFDTSCNAGAVTCNLTTTANGDLLLAIGQDLAREMTPGTGFAQQQYGTTSDNFGDPSNVNTAVWARTGGNSGTETMAYVDASSQVPSIVGYAIKIPNPPTLPAVYVVDSCNFAYPNTTRSPGSCPLHNYTANNFVVYGFATEFDSVGITSCTGSGCNCPAASQSMNTYAGQIYIVGVCTGTVGTNQSLIQYGVNLHTGLGQSGTFVQADEYVGTTGVEDTGARAATNALSTSYTTAGSNEYTVTACFDNGANPLLPGGSALAINGGNNQNSNPTDDQMIMTTQTTAAAGSHTTSCSETGSSRPMIATTSIGIGLSILSPRQTQIF